MKRPLLLAALTLVAVLVVAVIVVAAFGEHGLEGFFRGLVHGRDG